MHMDASDYAVGGVLFQLEGEGDNQIERPIAFGGRKYKDAEKNYSIREKELLAILFGLRIWRVYLLDKPFVVETDHKSLESIFSQKSISRRIARWYDELSEYPISFKYIPGEANSVADGISRRPDFQDAYPLEEIVSASVIKDCIAQGIRTVVEESISRYNEDMSIRSTKVVATQPIKHLARYNLVGSKLFYSGPNDEAPRLVLPAIDEILNSILYEFHDVECYGHPGIERTLRLAYDAYCEGIREDLENLSAYQGSNTKPPGLLQSQPIPKARWSHVAMDFIVALPMTETKFDSVLVVVDQLTKRAHFVACCGTATAQDVAELYRDHIFVLHGVPSEILSDRDPKFTATNTPKMTSTFRHQANDVTERLNQTLENYLRAFMNKASTG
ncbi:reverse transcriptase [Phytophthora megakarya]|uniref:Reverse transcriptase n=1 Tax=Phytophthora megakarya TaxID=4795 RepID=A0A225UKI5_9STRA|nr:reverse transcriptase [Phytophthora megakarya]